MSQIEGARAPGIGSLDALSYTNSNTRVVKVVSDELTPAVLHREVGNEAFRGPGVSRAIVKGISRHPYGVGGLVLDHTVPFAIEAEIPFRNREGETLYWNVVGRNTAERTPSPGVVEAQRQMIRTVASNPKYEPQSVAAMMSFIANESPGLTYEFDLITPHNFRELLPGLQILYGEAFKDYPYDVVKAIGESCGDRNLYVIARGAGDRIYSITGAEYLPMGNGVTVAEIGDTASLPGFSGFGSLLKRVLFQAMIERGDVPDLVFTDSRLDTHGSVIKANRRAGLHLNPDIILPGHTTIASARNQGLEMKQTAPDGGEFSVENMTMTHLTRDGIYDIISTYGNAY